MQTGGAHLPFFLSRGYPGGFGGGLGHPRAAITLDPRGRSRFRDCNFEGPAAPPPREKGRARPATPYSFEECAAARRCAGRGLSAVVPRRLDTRRLTGAIADAAAPHLNQIKMPALTSAIYAACRPAPPLRPVPQMPGAHEARHDDPNLCVLLLALPRALSQPELCPQLRAWLPFRVWGHPRKGKGRRAKASRSAPLCFVAGSDERGTAQKIPIGSEQIPQCRILNIGRETARGRFLSENQSRCVVQYG